MSPQPAPNAGKPLDEANTIDYDVLPDPWRLHPEETTTMEAPDMGKIRTLEASHPSNAQKPPRP